ncbi:MAG TPA: TetR family transcriptional regulator [Lacunisphaera sp.]|nr:TetR family transcriptional regulator [Lacunisphaera sp.]
MFIRSKSAKVRILISAEALFAEKGFHAISIREVATKADVNVAGVNYHYYDLESLLKEILVRRLRTVNSIRMTALEKAEADSGLQPTALAEVLRIMARPLLVTAGDPMEYNRYSRRLLGRLLVEPFPNRSEILAREFEPTMARFAQALRRHAPGLAPADFMWRFSLIVGALHHSLATLHEMKALTRGLCADNDFETALDAFVAVGERTLGA